ncbi:hypothetical protein BDV96DRAFT_203188 [Lophiotrema nucula]|uniref:Secreted protein n=1 Tax=Lophiotrema nucula TaxID=690887 RepID=A0A6A5ZN17_9PLEO|nr:hypothetical protein BDV96DRAFT_203188 [Lophiotrema nucula]
MTFLVFELTSAMLGASYATSRRGTCCLCCLLRWVDMVGNSELTSHPLCRVTPSIVQLHRVQIKLKDFDHHHHTLQTSKQSQQSTTSSARALTETKNYMRNQQEQASTTTPHTYLPHNRMVPPNDYTIRSFSHHFLHLLTRVTTQHPVRTFHDTPES